VSTALLIAEQESATRGFLSRHLAQDGFAVVEATAGQEALVLAEERHPDLALLGDELPDLSGAELCRRLREGEPGRSWNRDVPVILLGQPQADAVDRVRAFARGCDDYVGRPFHYEELLARIHAVLRRSNGSGHDRLLEADGIAVDIATRRVTVGGERVLLSSKEYDLLVKLASEPERVFKKDELLRDVWGFRSLGTTRTLDSHACRLRQKLAVHGDRFVVNVWGVGYRLLDGPVAA
jgi:DNA-binding response OmpR family regulator